MPSAKLPGSTGFGPFRVNLEAGELFRGNRQLRLSGQPFKILSVLLTHAPEIVTREQLRQAIWAGDTFVDFEHSLNAAVNRLRRVLCDSAQNPRYIETIPGRGYRFIGTLDHPVAAPAEEPPTNCEAVAARKRFGSPVVLSVFSAALLVIVALIVHTSHRSLIAESRTGAELIRLTADPGLTAYPSISRDGKFVAYASDRSQEGRSDLYVQQVPGGSVVQITADGERNTMPNFSPDGRRIVFRSGRDGGGIFDVRASGGEVRPIVSDGFDPKYSPDGSMIAFWRGTPSVADSVPWSASAWVVSSSGGQPRRIGGTLAVAKKPMWLPDSKHLIVVGYDSDKNFQPANVDWWLVSIGDDNFVRLPLRQTLIRAGLNTNGTSRTPAPSVPAPGCWVPADSSVLFSTGVGDATNIWSATFSMSDKSLTGTLTRKTTGSGNEWHVSCSEAGDVAFSKLDDRRDLWSMPVDINAGQITTDLSRLTIGPAWHETPAISADERGLAFASFTTWSRPPFISMRDLHSGIESQVATSNGAQRYPAIDHTGRRVAFTSYDPDGRSVYVAAPGSPAERVCAGCLRATDWSSDDKTLLLCNGNPYRLELLHLRSGQKEVLLRDPNHHLMYGRFSPDDQWVSFTKRLDEGHGAIVVAPVSPNKASPESDWIVVASVSGDDWANWSADAQTLYYSSSRDGYACLWAQTLHPITKRPIGQPFAVRHFHGRASFDHGGWSVGRDRLVISLLEPFGNVWLMPRPKR